MNSFISFAQTFRPLLIKIVAAPQLHAKWVNTLSFLENTGAKKIAGCEHPTLVKEEMLKHAAEEFRHAHYLKHQIEKISAIPMDTYSLENMLGGYGTLQYLNILDTKTSRYLKGLGIGKDQIKEVAYLLVTYAIELRAGELYPIYDEILKKAGSKVAVKSIILEEKEHLNDMKEGIKKFPFGHLHAAKISAFESNLCKQWILSIKQTVY